MRPSSREATLHPGLRDQLHGARGRPFVRKQQPGVRLRRRVTLRRLARDQRPHDLVFDLDLVGRRARRPAAVAALGHARQVINRVGAGLQADDDAFRDRGIVQPQAARREPVDQRALRSGDHQPFAIGVERVVGDLQIGARPVDVRRRAARRRGDPDGLGPVPPEDLQRGVGGRLAEHLERPQINPALEALLRPHQAPQPLAGPVHGPQTRRDEGHPPVRREEPEAQLDERQVEIEIAGPRALVGVWTAGGLQPRGDLWIDGAQGLQLHVRRVAEHDVEAAVRAVRPDLGKGRAPVERVDPILAIGVPRSARPEVRGDEAVAAADSAVERRGRRVGVQR